MLKVDAVMYCDRLNDLYGINVSKSEHPEFHIHTYIQFNFICIAPITIQMDSWMEKLPDVLLSREKGGG